jgi:hypothetical protein
MDGMYCADVTIFVGKGDCKKLRKALYFVAAEGIIVRVDYCFGDRKKDRFGIMLEKRYVNYWKFNEPKFRCSYLFDVISDIKII